MILYEKITKSYQAGINAVADFTLSIAKGELLAISRQTVTVFA